MVRHGAALCKVSRVMSDIAEFGYARFAALKPFCWDAFGEVTLKDHMRSMAAQMT
jgi:hypothetical protein